MALTSHELRTPVTVIKGYADTLNDRWDALDDGGRRHAARVLGQRAGDLARLLDRLLSAVGEPGIPPVVSRFDLRAAITRRCRRRCRRRCGRGSARELPAPLPPVFGEQASIAQRRLGTGDERHEVLAAGRRADRNRWSCPMPVLSDFRFPIVESGYARSTWRARSNGSGRQTPVTTEDTAESGWACISFGGSWNDKMDGYRYVHVNPEVRSPKCDYRAET